MNPELEPWQQQDLIEHCALYYQLGKEGKLKMTTESPARAQGMSPVETSREFPSGATRSSDEGKLNFIGAMSPFALEAYLDFLRRHNNQAHRSEENWKKGIPLNSFMASEARHFLEQWKLHATGWTGNQQWEMIDAICGVIFNAFGYLHELVKPDPRIMLDEYIKEKFQ